MAAEKKTDKISQLLKVVATYDKEFKKWCSRVEKILKIYRDENRTSDRGEGEVRFNILWSNVQTLVPATYSRIPKADVSRRYRDQDDVGRVSSLILERALEYELSHYPDFRSSMKQSVSDRFLGGRGTAWARYEPHIRAVKTGVPTDGVQVTEDADEPQEELDYECAPVDYVHWKDFGHQVARTWEEVPKVWRRAYMQMDAKVERFGEELAKKIPKDARPSEDRYPKQQQSETTDDGSWIYELWDKSTKTVCWFHKDMKDVLEELEDPLGLEDFYPCPKPLYATLTNESLVPVPDYSLYQDQARSLDTLADRIYGLVNMLQVKGVYDGSADKAIGRLFTEGANGTLLPVKNWAAFAEKNGLKGSIDIMDLDPISRALKEAYTAFGQIIQFIYQITGIADIVRGVSDPNETLGAQEIKKNFVGLRLGDMKMSVAQFATEIIQLKAQIICTKFDPQTILKIAAVDQLSPEDQALVPQALALLVGEERLTNPDAESPNPMRSFRIEVNADSLVQIDEQQEKESRMELMTAFGTYLEKGSMLVAQAPMAAPLIIEVGKFVLQSFKVGKNIEGTFDALLDKMKQPQPPKPDPEMAKVEAQKAKDQAQLQHDNQAMVMEDQRARMQEQSTAQREEQISQREHQREMEKISAQERSDAIKCERDQETELKKAALAGAVQIEIAKITASVKAEEASKNAEIENKRADNEAEVSNKQEERASKESESSQKMMQSVLEMQAKLMETILAPKKVIRDTSGKISGVA